MRLFSVIKILKPICIFYIVGVFFIFIAWYVVDDIVLKYVNVYFSVYVLVYFIYPFFVLLDFVRRKRQLGVKSYLLTFVVSLFPGFLTGLILGYGFFEMGHGGDFREFISVAYLFVVFFSLVSGLIGFLIDAIWGLVRKLD